MALFDRLITDHWRTTVIDLGYGLFEQFFTVMAEIGFEHEARQSRIEPVVLFITDSAPFTAQTYAELRGRLAQTVFVPVHNEAASFMFIAQDFPPTSPNPGDPHPAPVADRARGHRSAGFSFCCLYGHQPGGPTEVHSWISEIFGEFRDLELRLLIGQLESSLRGSGKDQVRQIGSAANPKLTAGAHKNRVRWRLCKDRVAFFFFPPRSTAQSRRTNFFSNALRS